MSRKKSALSQGLKHEIIFAAAAPCSVESIAAAINRVTVMQQEGTADGSYLNENCPTETPFSSSIWSFFVDSANPAGGGHYVLTFNSEDVSTSLSLGRAALSSRRGIIFSIANTTTEVYSTRSLQALLSLIKDFEDSVAETGNGAENDGTYIGMSASGKTPYITYTWNVVKSGNSYVATPTAGS